MSKAQCKAPGYKDEKCTVLSSRDDRHINLNAIKQFQKSNDTNKWNIMENMSIAKLSELNTYEHIIFKVDLFVLNTKKAVNNSIYIVEKKCDSSIAVKAIVSTN